MILIKVIIRSYTDKRLTKLDGIFPLPVSPDNYSQSFKVNYETTAAQGAQGTNTKYTSTAPEELKLDFFFDGTGTIEGYFPLLKSLSVSEQVKLFLGTAYDMEGGIHKPKFLKLNWGRDLAFDCVLTNLDINYTLFNAIGDPLRAKLSATFLNYIEQEKRVIRESKESPDLTHVKQVLAGNKLALMTYDTYGNSSFLTQIARVNNLTSFRNLKVEQEIIFPPLEKNEF